MAVCAKNSTERFLLSRLERPQRVRGLSGLEVWLVPSPPPDGLQAESFAPVALVSRPGLLAWAEPVRDREKIGALPFLLVVLAVVVHVVHHWPHSRRACF